MAESKRDALLAMHAQTGEAQRAAKPPETAQQQSGYLQVRPVLRDAMAEQERKAELVVNTAWMSFQKALG